MVRGRNRFDLLAAAVLPLIGAMLLRPEGAPGGAPGAGGGGGSGAPSSGGTGDSTAGGAGVEDVEVDLPGDDELAGDPDDATGGGTGDDDDAAAGGEAVPAGGGDDSLGGAAAEDTPARGTGADTVAGGAGETPEQKEKTEQAAAARQQHLSDLGGRYNDLVRKLTPGKDGKVTFDAIDDGADAIKTLLEIVQVQGESLSQLRESDQRRSTTDGQQRAAEEFWSGGYAKAWPAVPIDQGKQLWRDVCAWAKKNNRSQEQASARWETLMEAKSVAAKEAAKTAAAPKPTAPQVRTTGKPKAGAEPADAGRREEPARKPGKMPSLTGMALKRLWGG